MDGSVGFYNKESYNAVCCQISLEWKVDEPRCHGEGFLWLGNTLIQKITSFWNLIVKKHLLKVNHHNNKHFKCIFLIIWAFYFLLSVRDTAEECKRMVNETSFIIAENWTQMCVHSSKCLKIRDWINILQYIHTMESYAVVKKTAVALLIRKRASKTY